MTWKVVATGRRFTLVIVFATALATLVPSSLGEDPFPRKPHLCLDPSDIGSGCTSPYAYEEYLFLDDLGQLPNDYAGSNVWKYSSQQSGFLEVDHDPRELHGVTGMSIDQAWLRSTGRPDVVIAVLDSGIRWENDDTARKAHLNRGELPAPAASTNPIDPYDRNFDGVLNVVDYAGEVPDLNGNGLLDPQDLIRAFTDGTDDDANGFVDDISGWNFLDDTNDPFDEVDYGHGTGEAEDSAGEANNGAGFPGVCPSCRFLPLRVGQSFIAHDEDYAQAVLYAVDHGASVVQEALGTVDNVPLARDAHRYAWDRGVTVVASAADEAAYHHNFPSGHDFTINVNSIRNFPGLDPLPSAQPRSYLYVNGCTNFGGNVWVSISSTSCSSEATGRAAGIAGLIVSHAKNLAARGLLAPHPDAVALFLHGSPLSAAEVRQLFRAAADDVDLSTHREVVFPIPTVRYASQPGWDQYTGWGRLNASKALELLSDGVVPPEASIMSPPWWAAHDALAADGIDVDWLVRVHRVPGPFNATLSFGCGVQPLLFFDVVTRAGDAPAVLGDVDRIPMADLVARCGLVPHPPVTPNDYTVTLRMSVADAHGVVGEDRRTIQVGADPTLVPGWPQLLEGSGEASPDLVDLDRDGRPEIVVPTAAGLVHARRIDGSEAPGFPAASDPMPGLHGGQPAFQPLPGALDPAAYFDSLSHGGTAIGDADADGDVEIFASSLNGRLYGWDHAGARLDGFPVGVDPSFSLPALRDEHNTVLAGFEAAPVLADLDGDGDLEVIVAAMDRHVYAWHHGGAPVAGFPVHLADPAKVVVDPATHRVTPLDPANAYRGAQILSTTAVGDIDGDGAPEIVVGTNEHYREPPAVSAASVTSTLVESLGILDTGNGRLYALEADGALVSGFPLPVPLLGAEVLPYVGEGIPGSVALADLDGDGADEIVVFATVGPVMVYRGDGSSFYGDGPDGKPLGLSMELVGPASGAVDVPVLPALGSPAVGRLLPGLPAIVAPATGLGRGLDVALPGEQLVSQDYVQAWDATTGLPLAAWPRPIEDFQFLTTPALVNVDADPLVEVVQGSGGYLLHAWDATGAESPGFPKATNHWLIGTVAVGDLDGDGLREVVETSREGWLWVWRTTALAALSQDEWWSDHHDEANTGRWAASPLAPEFGARGPGGWLDLLPALLVVGPAVLRRRRDRN